MMIPFWQNLDRVKQLELNKTVKRLGVAQSSLQSTYVKALVLPRKIDFGSFANEELIGFISCSVNTCQKGRAPES